MKIQKLIDELTQYQNLYGNVKVIFIANEYEFLTPDFNSSLTRVTMDEQYNEKRLIVEVV